MDFVQRNKDREQAMMDCWDSLTKECREAIIGSWNQKYPNWTWNPDPQDKNQFCISRNVGGKVFNLCVQFDDDSGEVKARGGTAKEGPVLSLHKIVYNRDSGAWLQGSDGKLNVDDVVDAILWPFLKKYRL